MSRYTFQHAGRYPIRELIEDDGPVHQLLQASAEPDLTSNFHKLADYIFVVKGDHSEELFKICFALAKSKDYVGGSTQIQFLTHYIECFRAGNLKAFKKSQKAWVIDVSAMVEHLIGSTEPYHESTGVRSKREAMVGIVDPNGTSKLKLFVQGSRALIRQLPWALEGVNDGKEPFKKSLFEAPELTSVHGKTHFGL